MAAWLQKPVDGTRVNRAIEHGCTRLSRLIFLEESAPCLFGRKHVEYHHLAPCLVTSKEVFRVMEPII